MTFTLKDNLVSKSIRKHRIRLFRGYVALAFFVFLILAVFSKNYPYFKFDLAITTGLQKFDPVWFDMLMKIVTLPGNPPWMGVIVMLTLFLLFVNRLRWEAICAGINAGGYLILERLIKLAVQRIRPAEDLVKVFVPIAEPSFPSGHVLGYVCYFGFLAFLAYSLLPKKHLRTGALIFLVSLISLVGLSRIYLGAHWFSDTLGAYLLGSSWLFITVELYFWGRSRFFKKDPTVIPLESELAKPK